MNPSFVRFVTYPLQQWRMGRNTLRWLHPLRQTPRWSEERLKIWREEKLRSLLNHAFTHVPYYQALFKRQPIDLKSESLIAQFQTLPLLSKEVARERFYELQATDRSRSYEKAQTSGSTGTPMIWHIDFDARSVHEAVRIRCREWWGFDLGIAHVLIWGDDEFRGRRKAVRDLWVYNKRVLRLLDLSEKTVGQYYKNLVRWKPTYLYGYPSGFVQLALLCEKENLSLKSLGLKGIISTAEILTPSQRFFLQEIFGCPVINEYGYSEAKVIAFECPQGNMHLNTDTLMVEFLQNGQPVKNGERGEVVITDLFNRVMPLIRHQTGDLGIPKEGQCSCRRTLPLMAIAVGRQVEMIRLPDGRFVHPEIFTPPHNDAVFQPLSEEVKRFRVYQETLHRFRIQVVTRPERLETIRDRFIRLVERYLGKGFEVQVERVEEIEREPSGKLRYFISRIPSEPSPSADSSSREP